MPRIRCLTRPETGGYEPEQLFQECFGKAEIRGEQFLQILAKPLIHNVMRPCPKERIAVKNTIFGQIGQNPGKHIHVSAMDLLEQGHQK
jgi:hypothetical protein